MGLNPPSLPPSCHSITTFHAGFDFPNLNLKFILAGRQVRQRSLYQSGDFVRVGFFSTARPGVHILVCHEFLARGAFEVSEFKA